MSDRTEQGGGQNTRNTLKRNAIKLKATKFMTIMNFSFSVIVGDILIQLYKSFWGACSYSSQAHSLLSHYNILIIQWKENCSILNLGLMFLEV